MRPVKSHIADTDFPGFLEKLKCGHEKSWYQLDFVLKRIICKWLIQKKIPVNDSLELYNDVFSILYEKLPHTRFASFGNLKSYVFAIAENKVKEYYRKNTNRRTLGYEQYSHYFFAITDSEEEENREMINQVAKCLKKLNNRERTIIDLVYKEGRSLKETAELLDIEEGHVRVIKHRAIGRIRKQISEMKNKPR
jgi:RNA polymerase sigma-70 factor (ECF subfamily)